MEMTNDVELRFPKRTRRARKLQLKQRVSTYFLTNRSLLYVCIRRSHYQWSTVVLTFAILEVLFILYSYARPALSNFITSLNHLLGIELLLLSALLFAMFAITSNIIGFLGVRMRDELWVGSNGAVMLFIMIAKGVLMIALHKDWDLSVNLGLTIAVQSYNPLVSRTLYIEAIQSTLECCGASGYMDYSIANMLYSDEKVPTSCCDIHKVHQANYTSCADIIVSHGINTAFAFQIGCKDPMDNLLKVMLIGEGFSSIALYFVMLVLAALYCVTLKDDETDKEKEEVDGYNFVRGVDNDCGITPSDSLKLQSETGASLERIT